MAASALPTANVKLMTRLILMPMRQDVSKSRDTARIAMPIFVLRMRNASARTRITVRMGVMNVTSVVDISPSFTVLLRKPISAYGYDFGCAVKR